MPCHSRDITRTRWRLLHMQIILDRNSTEFKYLFFDKSLGAVEEIKMRWYGSVEKCGMAHGAAQRFSAGRPETLRQFVARIMRFINSNFKRRQRDVKTLSMLSVPIEGWGRLRFYVNRRVLREDEYPEDLITRLPFGWINLIAKQLRAHSYSSQ